MQLKRTYLFILALILLSSFAVVQQNEASENIKLLTTTTDFEVGTNLVLKFTASESENPLLYCSNSYGSTVISSTVKNNIFEYHIPENITRKIGTVNWTLLTEATSLSGKLNINPKAEVATMICTSPRIKAS